MPGRPRVAEESLKQTRWRCCEDCSHIIQAQLSLSRRSAHWACCVLVITVSSRPSWPLKMFAVSGIQRRLESAPQDSGGSTRSFPLRTPRQRSRTLPRVGLIDWCGCRHPGTVNAYRRPNPKIGRLGYLERTVARTGLVTPNSWRLAKSPQVITPQGRKLTENLAARGVANNPGAILED